MMNHIAPKAFRKRAVHGRFLGRGESQTLLTHIGHAKNYGNMAALKYGFASGIRGYEQQKRWVEGRRIDLAVWGQAGSIPLSKGNLVGGDDYMYETGD
jgi:hypothetical protein